MKLTQERLKELLFYDPESGIFTRNISRPGHAAGNVAGTITHEGYIKTMVDGKNYSAHRLAWFYVYGYFPENQIDHINRIENDNRLVNLREVSQSCNMRNTGMLKNNKSGIKGVYFHKTKKRWIAQIKLLTKYKAVGVFRDIESAVMARWQAEKKYGFPNCCIDSSAYLYLKTNNLI